MACRGERFCPGCRYKLVKRMMKDKYLLPCPRVAWDDHQSIIDRDSGPIDVLEEMGRVVAIF